MSNRIKRLLLHLNIDNSFDDELNETIKLHVAFTNGLKQVTIGDVSIQLNIPYKGCEHLVPAGFIHRHDEPQQVLKTLRFMMQKDSLGQDIYLIGPPGPFRRAIAQKYCELVNRPMEYVALSQDTTESDLKQRREITNGTAEYIDCAAVRAATQGSILVLDGIEKAERNVMPLLNNLLENREMALEDGRFLVAPKRFDTLSKDHSPDEMKAWKLVRTSDQFRVIALGLPIPRYIGNTLDPPFRSRFQARDVKSLGVSKQLDTVLKLAQGNTDENMIKSFVQCAAVITDLRHSEGTSAIAAVPEYPQEYEISAGKLWKAFPGLHSSVVAGLLYPFPRLLEQVTSDERNHTITKVYSRFGVLEDDSENVEQAQSLTSTDYIVQHIQPLDAFTAKVQFIDRHCNKTVEIAVSSGNASFSNATDGFVMTDSGMTLFSNMVQAHYLGDFCLIGEKGGGKSALIHYFAHRLGYRVEHIPLYKDMTARSLFQRRTTLSNGDTSWEDSSLVNAALYGRLAVLDGVEQIQASTLSTLQQLIHDRVVTLPDGTLLLGKERWVQVMQRDGLSEDEMHLRNIKMIHPGFRIVALARPTSVKQGGIGTGTWMDWLGPEVACMFKFVYMKPMLVQEQKDLISKLAPAIDANELDQLMEFVTALRKAIVQDEMLSALQATISLRQLIRICKRLSDVQRTADDGLYESIQRASLSRFLPPTVHETLIGLMKAKEIQPAKVAHPNDLKIEVVDVNEKDYRQELRIGKVHVPIYEPRDPLLVPEIVFYDNPRQTYMMMEMLKDWLCGQHLLLIGNQGVGKNKMADRMLELLKLPREYIQLHRDTTVQNLTSNPTIVNGVLMYEDSPLVRAAREGRVLVVDEADKAPTYVTAILKALVEDHSMLLSDGRRIVDAEEIPDNPDREYIPLHPEFRMIALANRPGFPFHGNDFFREVGDVFASHAIDNPDTESEMHLLRQYGPDVPNDTLRKLIAAFDALRSLSDDGQLSYPYSTRELAAIVRHLQKYPNDSIDRILRNVFDFDNYSSEEKDILVNVFAENGIPFSLGMNSLLVKTGKSIPMEPLILKEMWWKLHSKSKSIPCITKNLDTIARVNVNGGNTLNWNLRSPHTVASLVRRERPSTIFTEELFNFHLPQGMVIGACALHDGSLVFAVRSSSFMLYHVNHDLNRCETYDLHAALPPDGTYRGTPKTASLLAVDPSKNQFGADLVVLNPVTGMLFALNLSNSKTFVFFENIEGLIKGKSIRMCCNAENEIALFQNYESTLVIVNLSKNVVSTVAIPGIELLNVNAAGNGSFLLAVTLGDDAVKTLTLSQIETGFQVCPVDRKQVDPKTGQPINNHNTKESSIKYVSPNTGPIAGFGNARFIGLDHQTNTFTTHLAPNLPTAWESGEQVPIYSTGFREPSAPQIAVAEKPRHMRVHPAYLSKNNIAVEICEVPDALVVDLYLLDINNDRQRVITIGVEDDPIGNPKQYFGTGKEYQFTDTGNKLRPAQLSTFALRRASVGEAQQRMFVVELSDTTILTVDCMGWCRLWLIDELSIRQSFDTWRKLVGKGEKTTLRIMYDDEKESDFVDDGDDEGEGNGKGKGKGKGNGQGDGEGQGEGNGSGGGEGQLSGGGGGGGSLSGKAKGKSLSDVSDLPDPGSFDHIEIDNPNSDGALTKSAQSDGEKAVDLATKQLKKEQWQALLKSINMSEPDYQKYEKYKEAVKTETRELRVVLENLEAKQHERVWLKNQSTGDLDDQKLIDGLTGERAIYKRRADQAPDNAFFQPLPKRMHFLFDLSMSMSRYAADGRLERSLEAAVMLMEALKGFEHKFSIKMSGHSGDSYDVPLVDFGKFPKNDKERLAVLKKMHAHAEMCDSGDNTLEAVQMSVREIVREEGDEYYCFLISDANLDQYGITPKNIEQLTTMDKRVHVFAIFIASMGEQAATFEKALPGRVYACLDKRMLPKTLRQMFVSAAIGK